MSNYTVDKGKSLGTRISMLVVGTVVFMMLFSGIIGVISMRKMSTNLIGINKEMGEISASKSAETLGEITQDRLLELAKDKADIVNRVFVDFENDVALIGDLATRIYSNPDAYLPREIPVPDTKNNGSLTLQLLYATGTNPTDPAIVGEAGLLGNIGETLYMINKRNSNMVSNYVATESGFMIQADYISAMKFDENGELMPLDAKDRPWYEGAVSTGRPYFTSVVKDLHTSHLGIMCGIPVYANGELKGVSGGGMYLDKIDLFIHEVDLGEGANACIINRQGQVLFSTFEEGDLAVQETEDSFQYLGNAEKGRNAELAALTEKAIKGGSGVELIKIEGRQRYVAYAPMQNVGWSLFIILSRDRVDAPARQLAINMNSTLKLADADVQSGIHDTVVMLVAAMVGAVLIASVLSLLFSRQLVDPILDLTEEVQRIQGDNLDFHWDRSTGDETQLLASSFESLTERMKDYIRDVEAATAERERIGTELGLAARIQETMIPNRFPAFPDRSEFDLHAVMDPAKEVGGDFYDYFLIDDDHLALVMADVSGKGIPGALFMMASRIIIKSNAVPGRTPSEILKRANEAICANNSMDMFVTVWLGILEISTGKLTASNAGHEYPFLCRSGRYEIYRDKHGLVIGAMDISVYKDYTLDLKPGDRIFVYTDGVPEATNRREELFGMERLEEALNADPSASCREIMDNVRRAVDDFVEDADQFDDLTMLCFAYLGKQEKTEE